MNSTQKQKKVFFSKFRYSTAKSKNLSRQISFDIGRTIAHNDFLCAIRPKGVVREHALLFACKQDPTRICNKWTLHQPPE